MDELEQARRQKLQRLIELGVDPWGSRFDDKASIGSIRAQASEIAYQTESGQRLALPPEVDLPAEERPEGFDFRQWMADQEAGDLAGPKVRTAGRIVRHRDTGKLQFVDIRDVTGEVQLFVGKKQVGDDWEIAKCFDLGDIIGVEGELKRTKLGELSIFATRLFMLTKCLETPPDKHAGLADVEIRQRRRYLDLAYTPGVAERFLRRSQIVEAVRKTFLGEAFVEVEGPTLHAIAGGAAARPFTTHHNTLDLDLYLRIALELHLKRLMVGGIERVFEIGRVYRNEGISPKHNPEFTMLEAYAAFGDYHAMMDLTEQAIVAALAATGQPQQVAFGDKAVDFSPPFQRLDYHAALGEATGVDPHDVAAIAKVAEQHGIETANRHPDVVKNDVFEELVEDQLNGPVFIVDYPASICPLTKRKAEQPEVAERFELFVAGMEVANAYTELNDPDLQQQLFETQLAGLSEEDSMAKMDHDFLRALRYGMPPAGGLGIGIDRLVMLLTNSTTIRDVILFPLLRPEADADHG